MRVGPVEYVLFEFPDNRTSAEIVPALHQLVDSGRIHLLDLIFISKDDAGKVTAVEVDQDEELACWLSLEGEVGGILGVEDVEHAAGALAPGSSAGLLIWEDIWATPLAEALDAAGGRLLEGARVPHDLVDEVLAALPLPAPEVS